MVSVNVWTTNSCVKNRKILPTRLPEYIIKPSKFVTLFLLLYSNHKISDNAGTTMNKSYETNEIFKQVFHMNISCSSLRQKISNSGSVYFSCLSLEDCTRSHGSPDSTQTVGLIMMTHTAERRSA